MSQNQPHTTLHITLKGDDPSLPTIKDLRAHFSSRDVLWRTKPAAIISYRTEDEARRVLQKHSTGDRKVKGSSFEIRWATAAEVREGRKKKISIRPKIAIPSPSTSPAQPLPLRTPRKTRPTFNAATPSTPSRKLTLHFPIATPVSTTLPQHNPSWTHPLLNHPSSPSTRLLRTQPTQKRKNPPLRLSAPTSPTDRKSKKSRRGFLVESEHVEPVSFRRAELVESRDAESTSATPTSKRKRSSPDLKGAGPPKRRENVRDAYGDALGSDEEMDDTAPMVEEDGTEGVSPPSLIVENNERVSKDAMGPDQMLHEHDTNMDDFPTS
ncbi:hypothetical protein HK097_011533, partial [Rhizophlyctis rosea]